MDEKLEVLDISNPTSILGSYGDAVIDFLKTTLEQPELVGVLSVDGEPVSDNSVVVEADHSDDYSEDFDAVKLGVLNEHRGLYITRKDGLSMFLTGSNVLDKCKLYEYNTRINDFYSINAIIINSLVYNVFVNKIKTQSLSNNIAYADIVIKRLRARGTHKAYVAVRDLLYDLFLNPSKEYSLETISSKSSVFTEAHREYLCTVLEKIKNDPRDFSFFNESDLNF